MLALVCSAGFLHADIVTLKDGKRLEGNILSETPTAIRMRYKLTPKIWDEKDIPRSEITEILKQKPEEVELIELKKLLPTPDLMTAEKYEQLIQDRLRPFVNRYPGTKEAAEVEKLVTDVQEEKEKVVGGGIKLEGRWLSPDEAKADSYNIKAYALRAAIMEKAEAKDFNGALKEFEKLANPTSGYIASVYYPKAVEEILAILTKQEAQIEQMIKDQPTLQKMRDESIKKLIEPDLTRFKDAISREKEQWKTAYDMERKSSKWFTPNKYDLPSLKVLSKNIITEKTRLKEIDIATITKVNEAIARLMQADLKAGQDAGELKKMGEAILEGETAAASADATSKQFYQNVFQAYRQRYAYAQQQLAMLPAQRQVQSATGAASGSSAIGGTGTPGMDDKVAAALAAAAGGTPTALAPGTVAPGTAAPAVMPAPGTVPVPGTAPTTGYPVQQPGVTPGVPAPGAAAPPAGYPTQPPQAAYAQPVPTAPPMAAPVVPAEAEGGLSTNTLLLIGVGVVVIVLVAAMSGGKKKK
ncbi:MAG: PTPDL family protein [Prosthecobacter sp.]|nr:PTPDL family protein [Prosthecobacter sp.]